MYTSHTITGPEMVLSDLSGCQKRKELKGQEWTQEPHFLTTQPRGVRDLTAAASQGSARPGLFWTSLHTAASHPPSQLLWTQDLPAANLPGMGVTAPRGRYSRLSVTLSEQMHLSCPICLLSCK